MSTYLLVLISLLKTLNIVVKYENHGVALIKKNKAILSTYLLVLISLLKPLNIIVKTWESLGSFKKEKQGYFVNLFISSYKLI